MKHRFPSPDKSSRDVDPVMSSRFCRKRLGSGEFGIIWRTSSAAGLVLCFGESATSHRNVLAVTSADLDEVHTLHQRLANTQAGSIRLASVAMHRGEAARFAVDGTDA
ncbi:hypothetical protein FHR51_003279 [Xanthomonas arboricola]|uniref:hypothetical protein n=1 Tax=Xanthomonas cannabis TaxID=1885674 RepID=UPI001620ABA0|nr:hypothetical protein [Xanthomonas cannabis]MBB3807108.1 hypothetical protein [Xanthomonas cannabis]